MSQQVRSNIMNKSKNERKGLKRSSTPHRRTSIGGSHNTKPTNKSKRKNFKSYRGQGK